MYFDNQYLDGLNDVAMVCLNDIERSELLEDSTVEEMEVELNNNRGEGTEENVLSSSMKSSSQQNLSSVSVNRSRFQQPSALPPPAPDSFHKFIDMVNTQFNRPVGIQPQLLSVPMEALDFQQKLLIQLEASFQEFLKRHNEQLREKEEAIQLKKRLDALEVELEEAKRASIASKKKLSEQVKLARSDQAEVRKKFEKHKAKKAAAEGILNEKKKEQGKVLAKMRSTVEEFNTQLELFKQYGIELLVNTGDESGSENSSPNSWRSNEIALQLTNINPKDPKEVYYIQMKQMNLAESSFKVHSVFPSFDKAYDVVQKANASQDFLTLLLDCKTNWLRSLKLQSSGNVEGNATQALFNSPAAPDADSSKELFESPPSDVSVADN